MLSDHNLRSKRFTHLVLPPHTLMILCICLSGLNILHVAGKVFSWISHDVFYCLYINCEESQQRGECGVCLVPVSDFLCFSVGRLSPVAACNRFAVGRQRFVANLINPIEIFLGPLSLAY